MLSLLLAFSYLGMDSSSPTEASFCEILSFGLNISLLNAVTTPRVGSRLPWFCLVDSELPLKLWLFVEAVEVFIDYMRIRLSKMEGEPFFLPPVESMISLGLARTAVFSCLSCSFTLTE
jgi:hypothetical protein